MTVSDNLSQNLTIDDKSQNNKLDVMILDHLFIQMVNMELQKKIVQSIALDPITKDVIDIITEDRISQMKQDLKNWEVIDRIIGFKEEIYIPQDNNLCQQIVCRHHNLPVIGQFRNLRIKDLVFCDYWWPELHSFITNYVQGCSICQQTKVNVYLTV